MTASTYYTKAFCVRSGRPQPQPNRLGDLAHVALRGELEAA